jgi:hypothetical protein
MAYDTKVAFKAMAKIVKLRAKSGSCEKTCREIYEDLQDVANAEGVVLEAFDKDKESGKV